VFRGYRAGCPDACTGGGSRGSWPDTGHLLGVAGQARELSSAPWREQRSIARLSKRLNAFSGYLSRGQRQSAAYLPSRTLVALSLRRVPEVQGAGAKGGAFAGDGAAVLAESRAALRRPAADAQPGIAADNQGLRFASEPLLVLLGIVPEDSRHAGDEAGPVPVVPAEPALPHPRTITWWSNLGASRRGWQGLRGDHTRTDCFPWQSISPLPSSRAIGTLRAAPRTVAYLEKSKGPAAEFPSYPIAGTRYRAL